MAAEVERQTAAVEKQMLPIFVSREHRLNIFCSCRTIKSFEKNEQMAAEQPPPHRPVKEKHL